MNLKPLYEKIVVKLKDKQEIESNAGIVISVDDNDEGINLQATI